MSNVNRSRQQDLNQISSQSLVGQVASAITIIVGCLVLLGWGLRLEFLESFFSLSAVSMKVNAALCFILSGVSLWLSLRRGGGEEGEKMSPPPVVARVCALTVQIIGWITLSQYLLSWNFGVDELLFRDVPITVTAYHPGRMGLNTALNFMLVGRAIELLGYPKTYRSYWYAQAFALLAGVISGIALMGYAYQVESLYHMLPQTKAMALHTAATFSVLCVGILGTRTDQGLMRVVTSDTYGGLLARRLLVAAIIVPMMLGWLILQGQRLGVYDPSLAISLLVVVLIISFCVLIWHNAALVEGLSNERDHAKLALRVKEEKLNSFVDANLIGIMFADIQGTTKQANDEFLRIIGYTREDIASGISRINLTPPEYLTIDEQGIAEAKANGACTPYEKEYIRKDGSRVPVLVGYTLVGEKREESVAFILDLSDRKQAIEALRQSEERFRLAVDNIPDSFVIYDAQRRIQFVNATALEQIQKSKEEVLGHTDEEILPLAVYESYLATLIQAQETGTLQTTEATINLPDHRTFTSFIKYVPILDEKGEIYQILGFADDITVRKQAEEALLHQQKWLEEVLNLMPTPLLFIEPGTARVTFANKAADKVAGGKFPKAKSAEEYDTFYHSTDVTGNPIPDEQAPGVRVAHGERIEGFELDWHTQNDTRSLLVFADTLPAMHGHPATCVLTFQDITNLKRVEKALSLGYTRLQLLFNTANDLLSSQHPVALVDSVFKKLREQIGLDVYLNYLVKENSQAMQLASYSGITEEFAISIEWLEFGKEVCGNVAAKRCPVAIENVQQSTDPKTEIIRSVGITAYYCYPLIAQGRLLGTLAFGSRSRLKFTANEIGMMQAVCDQIAIAMERASLITSLQQQTEQLREANRMKDEFLAILSHELRSPLNAILGWAQLLRSRKLDEKKIAQAIETIERNAKVQKQLIEDLLDISRMIRGKLRLNIRTCDLVPIVEAAIETVRLAAEAKEIDVQFSPVPDGEPKNPDFGLGDAVDLQQYPKFLISGDADRLQQVIWNLLSNAIKFTPSGGRVEIKLARVEEEKGQGDSPLYSPSFAKITVSDTGIGINSEFLPYVFDRFRQADSSSTRSHGGLGLGLAIVRHLVELHGGNVYVDSPGEGKGATFTVILSLLKMTEGPGEKETRGVTSEPLPLRPQPQREQRTLSSIQETSSAQECPALAPSLKGLKVLIVDDEADTRDYLTTTLKQCQANVMAVASAQEALSAILEWKPDVLVSDIGMPDEDGYSLIREVRRREAASQETSLEYVPDISTSPEHTLLKLPAAALTAYARAEDRIRAIKEGFQIHLPKPVEPAELATVVASLVGRT